MNGVVMKSISIFISATLLILTGNVFAVEPAHKSLQTIQSKASPKEVLAKLKEGNERYLARETRPQDFRSQAKYAAVEGQFPIAFVLNCMDSRSIPQVVFDQSAGSIFVGRVAGNVLSKNMLASMEYAALVGTRLFVVMGHTKCGAMEAACQGGGFDNVKHLISEIKPAVQAEKKEKPLNCASVDVVNGIAQHNVGNMIAMAKAQSPFLAKKLKDKDIVIVGAMHDIKTGKVTFID